MPDLPDSDRILDDAEHATAGGSVDVPHTLDVPGVGPDSAAARAVDITYRIDGTRAGPPHIEARVGRARVSLHEPVRLVTVDIPKPWGREIWYTGIEARGESRVCVDGGELPLSVYLSLAPRRLCGHAPVVLLKVLDPHPQPVIGDLYFETHERKQEVYVVVHVDPTAWPDGCGRIRFGMNQALRARYADDDTFRRDYVNAVRAYEHIRRAIDRGEAVASDREAQARANMDAFTELRPLSVGDVVVVPTRLPHSLQHGVRVIEFQTPTYERHIISFAQQVLTQDHWDTDTAVAAMRLDAPAPPLFERMADDVERIVAFEDFRVWRIKLAPGASFELPAHPSYVLCTTVSGTVRAGNLTLAAEEAAFVPGLALRHPDTRRRHGVLRNDGPAPAIALVAAPDL